LAGYYNDSVDKTRNLIDEIFGSVIQLSMVSERLLKAMKVR